jgi:uncharacterized protein YunC (DUF1805 family)
MTPSLSYSPEENYRMFCAIHPDQMEELLDIAARMESIQSIEGNLIDANSYPTEDFLSGPIDRLHDLAKRLRGDNKETLLAIIETLDDIAQCTHYESEHGRSELKSALSTIKKG